VNRLSTERRARIVHLLVEGMSMRSVTRLEGCSINTVASLIDDMGLVCREVHDNIVWDVACRRVEIDEVWAFVYAKARNVPHAVAAPDRAGDAYTYTAIDPDTKVMLDWMVGTRTANVAETFLWRVRDRVRGIPEIGTDGMRGYLERVPVVFGPDVAHGAVIKPDQRKPAAERGSIRYIDASGQPERVTTAYVERSNLTLRMGNRRYARKTNAFSKRLDKHLAMLAVFFLHYNFCRVHSTLGTTPAVAARLAAKPMDCEWMVGLLERGE